MACGRCNCEISEPDWECCWFCPANLCYECWEEVGHCGHPEAEAINEATRMADWETQAALIRPFACGTIIASTSEEDDNGRPN